MLLSVQHLENGFRRGPVSRTLSNVVKPYYPYWVDDNITASLTDVPFRFFGEMTAQEFSEVSPPGGWSPNVPETGIEHAIRLVDFTGRIDEERPGKAGILNIGSCEKSSFKRHNYYLHISSRKLSFVLLQLQQM